MYIYMCVCVSNQILNNSLLLIMCVNYLKIILHFPNEYAVMLGNQMKYSVNQKLKVFFPLVHTCYRLAA